MDIRLTDDVGAFASSADGFIRSDPFTSNVIAVEVEGIIGGRRQLRAGSLWVTAEEGGQVVGLAMRTPPYNLFLPRLAQRVAECIADALVDAGHRLPGVSGEVGTVERFLERWEALGGPCAHQRVSTRMYVLGTLRPPPGVRGEGRRAVPSDEDVVAEWLDAFHDEAMPQAPAEDFASMAGRRIAQGHFWVWQAEGGDVVSLAGVSPPAAGVARVGPVYTPPRARRRGYGAAVTAAATQAGIDAGAAHVVLYTDLANPTSNAIYQAIGYQPHHDGGEWQLAG